MSVVVSSVIMLSIVMISDNSRTSESASSEREKVGIVSSTGDCSFVHDVKANKIRKKKMIGEDFIFLKMMVVIRLILEDLNCKKN